MEALARSADRTRRLVGGNLCVSRRRVWGWGGVEKRKGRRETEKGKRGKEVERKGGTGETKIKWGNGGEEEQEGKC